jgi:hypothetical protein
MSITMLVSRIGLGGPTMITRRVIRCLNIRTRILSAHGREDRPNLDWDGASCVLSPELGPALNYLRNIRSVDGSVEGI